MLLLLTGLFLATWGLILVSDRRRSQSTDPWVGLKCFTWTVVLVFLASPLLVWALMPSAE